MCILQQWEIRLQITTGKLNYLQIMIELELKTLYVLSKNCLNEFRLPSLLLNSSILFSCDVFHFNVKFVSYHFRYEDKRWVSRGKVPPPSFQEPKPSDSNLETKSDNGSRVTIRSVQKQSTTTSPPTNQKTENTLVPKIPFPGRVICKASNLTSTFAFLQYPIFC